jgi:ribosomal protein L37E
MIDPTCTLTVTSITCHFCGRTSYNLNDVVKAYCAHCHLFHDMVQMMRDMRRMGHTHRCQDWTIRNVGICAVCEQPVAVPEDVRRI